MSSDNFLSTSYAESNRIYFLSWREENIDDAFRLWGNEQVTRMIGGPFTDEQIRDRWKVELEREVQHGIQYWPVYKKQTQEDKDNGLKILIGCCGLRPYRRATKEEENSNISEEFILEFGIHLLPEYWGQGYSKEAATCVIGYAFQILRVNRLFAGHHPRNMASRGLLEKLGFRYSHDEFYPQTGLNHPSYFLDRP